jgi:hypothetical protein
MLVANLIGSENAGKQASLPWQALVRRLINGLKGAFYKILWGK